MGNKTNHFQKWQSYFLEDTECPLCLYWQGKKLGCKLEKCCCENAKSEAEANGHIKRKRGAMSWHG
jgi:hypothetical protein